MLCSKFKHFLFTKSVIHNNAHIRYLSATRIVLKKWVIIDDLFSNVVKKESSVMSPLRIILRDFRAWSGWTRSGLVNTVARKFRRDRGVREVIQCFRHAFFRPRRTLLISATAAYKARCDYDEEKAFCDKSITDLELQELVNDLEKVEKLSKRTLFCMKCGKRLVIDKKQPGVGYCACKEAQDPESTEQTDGWIPYMEAEGVIIWRKEYKPGLGLYAYKVYGRYPEVRASDFAAVQIDGAYRRVWDGAVAALSVVERRANGLADQAVLHWEVLWPRLFANRDYVYIRRHKEFDVVDRGTTQDGVFEPPTPTETAAPLYTERPSVHSNAKRKAIENYARVKKGVVDNKVYVIVNRSCIHPDVPETKHAVRVSEYWSHMVVKTLNGTDKCGTEFVLTYYDEPAVGGMPGSVAAWASGRAAPAYLTRMRRAASEYGAWRGDGQKETPDFTPFVTKPSATSDNIKEEDMESSQSGPEMDTSVPETTRDQGTQTEDAGDGNKLEDINTNDEKKETDLKKDTPSGDAIKLTEEEETKNGKE